MHGLQGWSGIAHSLMPADTQPARGCCQPSLHGQYQCAEGRRVFHPMLVMVLCRGLFTCVVCVCVCSTPWQACHTTR